MSCWFFRAAHGLHLWEPLRMTDILCDSCSTVHQHCVSIRPASLAVVRVKAEPMILRNQDQQTPCTNNWYQHRFMNPQYVSTFPTAAAGYLSPSMGLKFSDVPNGLAAIGKVQQCNIWIHLRNNHAIIAIVMGKLWDSNVKYPIAIPWYRITCRMAKFKTTVLGSALASLFAISVKPRNYFFGK